VVLRVDGPDGAGKAMIAPNITSGPGGATAAYTDADWNRTIRHGVKPNGNPLFVMPREDFARLTDADTVAIIAYAKSLPPVAGAPMETNVPLADEQMAGAMEHQAALLLGRLGRDEPHVCSGRSSLASQAAFDRCLECVDERAEPSAMVKVFYTSVVGYFDCGGRRKPRL
jgi:hypothetical protein